MPTRPTLLYRLRAWLAQVLAVEPGKPDDGLVELSAGTERDKPWSELSREFSDALEAWRFNPLARRIEKVGWEPGDYRAETSYHEVRDPGSDEARVWRSPRAARAAGLRAGDKPLPIMLHYAVNRPVGCMRGESDLRPILEWLRRYSRWLEDRVSLNAAARAFVWVVRVPGRLVEAKAAQYRRPPTAWW